MNVAEDVIMRWLISKGYFIMPSLKDGRREADLLALKLTENGSGVSERLHVEVTVSSTPYCSYVEPESDADEYFKRKFIKVRKRVSEALRGEPSCWVVVGKLSSRREWDQSWEKRMKQNGVKVIRFDQVVHEYLPTLTTRPTDSVGQLFHILYALNLLREPLAEWERSDGAILKAIVASLSPSSRMIYKVLMDEADEAFTLEELAERTGYTRKRVRRALELEITQSMRHGRVPIHLQDSEGMTFVTGKVAEVFFGKDI